MGLLLQTPRARLRRAFLAVAAPYRRPRREPTDAPQSISFVEPVETPRADVASVGETGPRGFRRARRDLVPRSRGLLNLRAPRDRVRSSRGHCALDTWGRIAAREAYGDNVTVTNMRFGLVRTDMVAPSDVYDGRRALTPDQAAARVVRVLEDRPVVWGHPLGTVGEALGLLAPRVADFVMWQVDRRVPDSVAARGEVAP